MGKEKGSAGLVGLAAGAEKEARRILEKFGTSLEDYLKLCAVQLLTTDSDRRMDIISAVLENRGLAKVELSDFGIDSNGRTVLARRIVEV